MGDFSVRKIKDASDRRHMYKRALNDIAVFERMILEKRFTTQPEKIGAEQELCIVDQEYEPASNALDLLDKINDEHYTNELALFNLEINLDPVDLSNSCFTSNEKELLELLKKGYQQAESVDHHILMTGILPTLKYRHLQFEYMTPIERYRTLSKALSDIRGSDFEIHVQGVDEIIMSLGSVLFEACNTSFQLHLQIHPDDFVAKHNWAQMITGPILSACVNSPLLFGNELWAESRIALFKQSLDTRSSSKFLRKKLPRVYFGNDWINDSAAELWKNDIMRFPLIVTSDDLEDAESVLNNGGVPNLRGIRLHNGTTYTWNRICYGPTKDPHLRIECRYIPSGPSVKDEIANFAFWIGLMNNMPEDDIPFWHTVNFKSAKNNFIKAARYGLDTVFNWFGENVCARDLILENLLPKASKGLAKFNVAQSDIDGYLGIIEKRVEKGVTGSKWIVNNFRQVSETKGKDFAEKTIVKESLEYQRNNIPIHNWEDVKAHKYYPGGVNPSVEQFMTRDLIHIQEDGSLALVRQIFKWNNIHHLPVENQDGDLVGLITDGMMERLGLEVTGIASDVMIQNPVALQNTDPISLAWQYVNENGISGFPVVYKKKLVGLITTKDLSRSKQHDI